MPSPHLDVEVALHAWNRLNNVHIQQVTPHEIPDRGLGFVAHRDLSNEETSPDAPPALVTIPRDLVLSQEAVEIHAKEDGHFRELLESAGRKVGIIDISRPFRSN